MILAIDQGASKTAVALVGTDGSILANATTEGACYFSAGVEKSFSYIGQAVQMVLAQASGQRISRVYAGMAGANWPDEIAMLTEEIHQRYPVEHATVCNDCVVALRGGSAKPDSMVLCAGSGLNGAVVVDGELRQVLNNYVLEADQGALGLAGRALDAVFESHSGIREETLLTRTLLAYFGYDRVDDLLVGHDHGTLKHPVRSAAVLVLEAAAQNDPVALSVVHEFSKSVARYATGSLKKHGLIGKNCDIVLSGGIFKSSNPLFLETIAAEVHKVSQQAQVIHAKYEPVVGAALLALGEIGASPEKLAVCRKSARAMGLVRGAKE